MKQILLVPLALLLLSKSESQKTIICGTFKSIQKINVTLYKPVHGFENVFFYSDPTAQSPGFLDSFHCKLDASGPMTIMVYITNQQGVYLEKSVLFVFPNDSIHLGINMQNEKLIAYDGSNARGQQLFNNINKIPAYKFKPVINQLNMPDKKDDFIEGIDNSINGFVKRFDSLLAKGAITGQFRDYTKITFTQLLYHFVIHKFLLNYKQREAYTKYERDAIISNFYNKLPPTDNYVKSTYSSYYYVLDYYLFEIYQRMNLSSIEPLYESRMIVHKNKEYLIKNPCGSFFYIENETEREDLWAVYMLILMRNLEQGAFDETINQFEEIYPSSKWTIILRNQQKDIAQAKVIEYNLQSPIKFIKPTHIESIADLLNELPNDKPIFIDVWATWCGPCIKSFQYNKELDEFLIHNKIEKLYISIDDEKATNNWRAFITKYALGGYHYLANRQFFEKLKKVCDIDINDGFRIPRYMIISKDKKIVIKDAITPANLNMLKQQIKDNLK